jgi:peptidoglycan/xylan/chitin deacetylase (PgdA/CDA1 family)
MHLNGEPVEVLELGTPYQEEGATAHFHGSKFFRDGWSVDVLRTGSVNPNKVGRYNLIYWGRQGGWTTTLKRTVIVQDTTAPVITLTQDPDHYTLPGQPYEEEGYKAEDNYDGDITDRVDVREHHGIVTYSVSDSSGNTTIVHRGIVYDDPIPPELTLKGDKTVTIPAGTAYEEPGWKAKDSVDGDLTDSVVVKGKVDIYTAGTYRLTYVVKDAHGNKAKAKRTVVVDPAAQPEVVIPDKKVVYLTFDDGPGEHTEELLDVLAKYDVKVTFFTCNTSYPEVMAREAAEGHTVAIHSYTHEYKDIYTSEKAFFEDLHAQQDLIYEQTGQRTTLLRFPGGSSNESSKKYCKGIMTKLTQAVTDQGYQYYDWNVLSGDAGETKDTDKIVKNVIDGLKRHKDGYSIVLQHDIHGFSVAAVERIIVWGLDHGYTFLPLTSTSPTAHQELMN